MLPDSGPDSGPGSGPGPGPRRFRDDSGSSVVEAVIVVPVLMLLLLVGVQFALWMHAVQVVQVAASEGDRVARGVGGGPSAGVASALAVARGTGSDVTGPSVSVSVLPGDAEWLQVSGHATSIIPGLSFPVSASAIGQIQQFRSSE
jgi:hypothetical protein